MMNSLEMTPKLPPPQSNLQAVNEEKKMPETIFWQVFNAGTVSVFELNIFYLFFFGR